MFRLYVIEFPSLSYFCLLKVSSQCTANTKLLLTDAVTMETTSSSVSVCFHVVTCGECLPMWLFVVSCSNRRVGLHVVAYCRRETRKRQLVALVWPNSNVCQTVSSLSCLHFSQILVISRYCSQTALGLKFEGLNIPSSPLYLLILPPHLPFLLLLPLSPGCSVLFKLTSKISRSMGLCGNVLI